MGLNERIRITDSNNDSFEVSVHEGGDKLKFKPGSRAYVFVTPAEARELAAYLTARADDLDEVRS